MSVHYNAFISYRHHPEDIRVATQIHRALERFHVPKALRKKAKLPMRLFRDKDELPITSNLTGDIFEALKNSDYLIVICSVHTKESMWVQREIETFLQTHPRERVLTVLVNGEPYEVIPEILLYQDVTDPDTGETVRQPVEPLSCDWRMGHRKALKEELPRLAAALLHCGYDELRQRRKQYRMKQLIAVFSVALAASLALSAYFLYTTITIRNANIRIQENLNQALRNQSRFLATAAEERLEKGDRLTALALLQEALPSEENPRPYVADAEYMLTEALGLYSNRNEMAALGALIPSESASVSSFLQTGDRSTVFLRDSRGIVTGWDTRTLQKLCTIEPGSTIYEMIGTTARSGIVFSVSENRKLYCYSRDGQLLWKLDRIQDAVLSQSGEILYAIRNPGEDQRELLTVDTATGSLLRQPLTLDPSPSGELAHEFVLESQREENPVIPMIYWDSNRTLCLLDSETGAVTELAVLDRGVRTACETEDGKFLFMVGDGTGIMNGIYGGNVFVSSPSGSDIFCYDAAGRLLWTSKITTCLYTGQHTLRPVPGSDRIFCQAGDTVQLISAADGAVLQSSGTTSAVQGVFRIEENQAMGILEDGCIFYYDFQNNDCSAIDYNIESNLRSAQFGETIFTLAWNSTQVTAYSFLETPSLWEQTLSDGTYVDQFRYAGEDLAFVTRDEICLFDVEQQAFRWRIPRDYLDLCGFSEDGSVLWAIDGFLTAFAISAQTGEMTEYPIPRQWENLYLEIREEPRQIDNDFWFPASSLQTLRLYRFSPLTGETACWDVLSTGVEIPSVAKDSAESITGLETFLEFWQETQEGIDHEDAQAIRHMLDILPDFLQKAENAHLVDVQGNRAWILDGQGTLYQMDLEAGGAQILLEGLTAAPAFAVRESDGAVAAAVEDEILLFAPGEAQPRRVPLSYERGGRLFFRGEDLVVLCDSGYLLRFDGDLQQTGRTGLTVNSAFSTDLFSAYSDPRDITWEFVGDNKLYLNLFNSMNVVDCGDWSVSSAVPDCLLYDPEGQQFLCLSDAVLRSYPRYETAQLLDLARQQLGTFRLPQGKKDAYGID